MTLGERIYKLRTARNLSQGELAEALDVSRQSVSKWETDASVPELDKLVKLSELFSVSLDELVLDKKQPEEMSAPKVVYVERVERTTARKTVGVVLLCFAALVWLLVSLFGDIVAGLVLAAPFAVCGLVCLIARKNAGLWCAWVVYSFVVSYLQFATGVNRSYILYWQVYAQGMTGQLIVAWLFLIVFVALVAVTVIRMKKAYPISLRKEVIGTAVSWGLYLLTGVTFYFVRWFVFLRDIQERALILGASHVSLLTGWLRDAILVVAVVFTARLLTALREKRKRK